MRTLRLFGLAGPLLALVVLLVSQANVAKAEIHDEAERARGDMVGHQQVPMEDLWTSYDQQNMSSECCFST